MRNLSFLLLFALFSAATYAQALAPNSRYETVIHTLDDEQISYTFETDEKGTVDIPEFGYEFGAKKTQNHQDQTTMTFINSGGVWTESQTFIFTKGEGSVIYVYFLRVVTNEGDDPWEVMGLGKLTKV